MQSVRVVDEILTAKRLSLGFLDHATCLSSDSSNCSVIRFGKPNLFT